jgi:hypothetical protein
VTQEINSNVLVPFTESERLKSRCFICSPRRPLDGYPAHFFQRHWEICGAEVTQVVLRLLRGEDDPASINNTFIVTIPKLASPKEPSHFGAISVCNVIFKITERLAPKRSHAAYVLTPDTRSPVLYGRPPVPNARSAPNTRPALISSPKAATVWTDLPVFAPDARRMEARVPSRPMRRVSAHLIRSTAASHPCYSHVLGLHLHHTRESQ